MTLRALGSNINYDTKQRISLHHNHSTSCSAAHNKRTSYIPNSPPHNLTPNPPSLSFVSSTNFFTSAQ
ncbi:hypothetical protein K503DRAFT_770607 [Rhizopogon vinicolor AM-OR11-026]|uniref:Uncharacterized protein n=1 Tax=Rhizopogon vinicolor AM-OR11-026 TaxID=1314800 RepID=A0A1B7N0D5_9AGAM|nr:hypothetical protein K503DRAFT_770607 [Rhizopogon vinicolor AM-OR11-026]